MGYGTRVINSEKMRGMKNDADRSRSRQREPTPPAAGNALVSIQRATAASPQREATPPQPVKEVFHDVPAWLKRAELLRIRDHSDLVDNTARPRGLYGSSYTSDYQSFALTRPEYEAPISNAEFYRDAFDNRRMADNSWSLMAVMAVIRKGYAVTSDRTCILTATTSEEEPLTPLEEIHMREYWVKRLNGYVDSGHSPFTIKHWDKAIRKDVIAKDMGTGAYNSVILLEKMRCTVTNEESGPRTCRVVLRENRSTVIESDIVKEIYFTGYASNYGIGPQLLASYYRVVDTSSENAALNSSAQPVKEVVSLSAAWDGDVSELMAQWSSSSAFSATFGKLFVELIVKSVKCGIFHADIKPMNLLYCWTDSRPGNFKSLKLCMTDFDPEFITLMTPDDRTNMQGCAVVAMVAMFLGVVRCSARGNNKIWEKMRNGIKKPLRLALDKIGGEPFPRKGTTLCDYLTYEATMHSETVSEVEKSIKAFKPEWDEFKLLVDAAHADVDEKRRDLELANNMKSRGLRSVYQEALNQSLAKLNKTNTQFDIMEKYLADLMKEHAAANKGMVDDMRTRAREKRLMQAEDDYVPYTGQMMHATEDWQRHVGHYITNKAWYRTQHNPDSKHCLKLDSDLSLYDQVVAYAFEKVYTKQPMNKTMNSKSIA